MKPETNREQLDHLKRLDEWESVVNLFAEDLETLKDAMIADLPGERLAYLSAKAQMAHKYLEFALEKPADEEG